MLSKLTLRSGRAAFTRSMGTIKVDNPYTGEIYCEVEERDPAGAFEVIEASAVAQKACELAYGFGCHERQAIQALPRSPEARRT